MIAIVRFVKYNRATVRRVKVQAVSLSGENGFLVANRFLVLATAFNHAILDIEPILTNPSESVGVEQVITAKGTKGLFLV